MKSPPRSFVVEIKRRGKKLASTVKTSIWPDLSEFRENDTGQTTTAVVGDAKGSGKSAQGRTTDAAAKSPRILQSATRPDQVTATDDKSIGDRKHKPRSGPDQRELSKVKHTDLIAVADTTNDKKSACETAAAKSAESKPSNRSKTRNGRAYRYRAKVASSLPREERWKRRLPKILW